MKVSPAPIASPSTLRDIAKILKISHSTVSRGLHNNPNIALSLRKKIRETAKQIEYRPNPLAVGLGQQRYNSQKRAVHAEIAWINYWESPERLRSYRELDLYWQGACEAAEQSGYRLEEFVCNHQNPISRLKRILAARNIQGILIPPHPKPLADMEVFNWLKFSVVRFGYSMISPASHIVTSNQLINGQIAFENIQKKGYKRIGFITTRHITTRFKAGFLVKQLEVEPKNRVPILILPVVDDFSVPSSWFLSWLKMNRPDAIVTDIASMQEMLKQAGYQVPRDIGLAAMSVLDGSATAGIYQNSKTVGKAGAEMLISLINHDHRGVPDIPTELLIEGRWVDGPSLPGIEA